MLQELCNGTFNPGAAGALAAAAENRQLHFFMASLLDQVNKETHLKTIAHSHQACTARTMTILLADDDSDDRDLFAEAICEIQPDIKVIMVSNGDKLMKSLHDKSESLPALIFLDLNMPGKSGRDCLLEIKSNSLLMGIPVVIYSTSSHPKDIEETHALGANLYICKPNSFKALISVIRQALSIDIGVFQVTPPIKQYLISTDPSKEK